MDEFEGQFYKISSVDQENITFRTVCGNEENQKCHERMLQFLHKAGIHNLQPIYEDKTLVTDPLVLLELGEMRCGHVARLACDFFDAVGYQTRLVQLGGHIIAEIWYENAGHYFDADIFSKGETAYLNGKIPSVEELSYHPYLIDSLNTSYYEAAICSSGGQILYPSNPYFNINNYKGKECFFYVKEASETECLDRYYGWTLYRAIIDEKRVLFDSEVNYESSVPKLQEVVINTEKDKLWLKWEDSNESNGDLLGYRIFVGSRNYDYEKFFGEEEVKKYWSGLYNGSMYEEVGNLPLSDLGEYETEDTEIQIKILSGMQEVYITVMPYDRHGIKAGRTVFKVSNELKIKVE